jgi:hypothetical protein
MGEAPWGGLCWGVMEVIFMFGRDMPNPGPILSDQCRMFANLFMVFGRDRLALEKEDVVDEGGGRSGKGESKSLVPWGARSKDADGIGRLSALIM